MGCDGMGGGGIEWEDGMGWDRMGWDGMGWDGMEESNAQSLDRGDSSVVRSSPHSHMP